MPRQLQRSALSHRYTRIGWADADDATTDKEKTIDAHVVETAPSAPPPPPRLLRRGGGVATVRRDRKPFLHIAALALVVGIVVALFTATVFVPTLLVCHHGGGGNADVVIAGSRTWAHGAGCPFDFMKGGDDRPAAVVAQAVAAALHVLAVGAVYAGLLGLLVTDPGITATPMHGELAGGGERLSAPVAPAVVDKGATSGLATPFSPTTTTTTTTTTDIPAHADQNPRSIDHEDGDDERQLLTSAATAPPPPLPPSRAEERRGGISRQGVWLLPQQQGQGAGAAPSVVEMYRKVCRCCDAVRGPRTAHCARCNVCVAGFDHHCGVTDTCVGAGNVRVFLLFVGGLCVLCDWCAVWCSAALYAGHAESRRGVVEASSIGLLFIVLVNTLQLHAGLFLYGRLYVCLGVTLREHRKRGGLYKGRELATVYSNGSCCRRGGGGVSSSSAGCCGCCSSDDDDDSGPADETATVPRPFDRGILRNAQRLLCGGCCCCALPCCCCRPTSPGDAGSDAYRWKPTTGAANLA